MLASLSSRLKGQVDLLLCNPPYVATEQEEVRRGKLEGGEMAKIDDFILFHSVEVRTYLQPGQGGSMVLMLPMLSLR